VTAAPVPAPPNDVNADLGFGSVVVRESRQRLLNRDGTFNVRREGLPLWQSLAPYHYLLNITWPRFLSYLGAIYISTNAIFATIYVLCGARALSAFEGEAVPLRFVSAFFFSVQTLATIGYGSIAPANIAANVVVTVESLTGLLGFALVAGVVVARFARPRVQIVFSRNAIIAPYRGIKGLMFRIVNQRSNEIVQVEAKVLMARRKKGGTENDREFITLGLERSSVVFFPLAWTIVHPIDEKSPLHGLTDQELRRHQTEFLVLLNGFDETYSQTVHTRSSYLAEEVVWGAKFRSMFNPLQGDGTISIDIRRIDEFDLVALD